MVGNPGGSGTPILSLFSPRVALAAPELAARAGYFGQIPPHGWVPVEVWVRNKEATAFRGQAEVRQVAGFGAGPGVVRPSLPGMPGSGGPGAAGIPGTGGSVAVRWRVPVEVPPGEDRHVVPWIWWDPGAQYEVHLVDESGRSVASTPLQHSSSRVDIDTWVGVVFGNRSIPYLRTLPGVRGGTVVAAEAMPYVLPRSSSGWFGFDVVVIDGAAALQQLQPDQLESLRLWVKLGGTLVLGTGSDAAAMARVLGPELFPWTVRDTVETSSYEEAVALARRVDPEAPDLGEDAPPSVAAVLAGPEGGAEGETGEAARNAGADGQAPVDGRNAAPERAAGSGAGREAGSSVPLAYKADVGLGRVYVWATRLDSEPWLSWSGMPDAIAGWLGADLAPGQVRRADSFAGGHGMRSGSASEGATPIQAPVSGPLSIEAGGPRALALALARGPSPMTPSWSTQDILLQAGRDLPGLQLPGPGMMAAGIAGYLLVIGPVAFGLLRRRRRREWAWIAVPALALASIAVAYGASAALGAAAPRNAAGFLFVTPDGDSGLWSGAVATYRPAGSPSLDLGRGVLVAPARSSAFGPPPDLEGGGGLTAEPALAGTRLSWPSPVPGRIPVARVQMDVTLGGSLQARWRPAGTEAGDWDVEVVNGLDFPLKNPVIILGGQTLDRLPDLAPGEAYRGRVRLPSRPAPGPWAPVSSLFAGQMPVTPLVARSPGPGPASGQAAPTWRDRQEARLQQALAEASHGMASGAILVATVDGTPLFGAGPGATGAGGAGGAPGSGDAGNGTGDGRPQDRQPTPWTPTGTTLLVQPLVPTFPAAGEHGRDFVLTNAVVPLAMWEARATSVDSPNTGTPVQVENGVFEMEWQPPAAVVARASTLRIQLPSSIGIELYDHADGRWVTLRVPGQPGLPTDTPAWVREAVRLADGNEVWVTGAGLGRFFGPHSRLYLRLTVEGQAALPMPIVALDVRGR